MSTLVISSRHTTGTSRAETGIRGEAHVVQHLIKHGYTICQRNYRFRGGEIDIIATQEDRLIFVEVKTRRVRYLDHLSAVITPQKQYTIIRTARHYLLQHQSYAMIIRFDVALVYEEGSTVSMTYFPNAFTATGDPE